jgi:hypothetical protein
MGIRIMVRKSLRKRQRILGKKVQNFSVIESIFESKEMSR